MDNIKRIGVLTSGGDAPGMNAAIRAVVRTAIYHGFEVYGIFKGFEGLIKGDLERLNARSVSDILQKGGTMLKTARSAEFKDRVGMEKALSICKIFNIDVVVIIGGDGSYRGADEFSGFGMPVICIPGTIDNDITSTEYTIGYDTALNTVQDAIDKIRDTAYSHERCSIIEVMGRHSGYIAINNGIAGGADVILIPEVPYDMDEDIIKPILMGRNRGKKDFTIVCAEGVGNTNDICKAIELKTGIITRSTILGYVQRGGSPTAYDRVMASRMGAKAVETLKDGRINRVISLRDNRLVDLDLKEALTMEKSIDSDMIRLSRILAI
ncbi:MAG: 6-phosphofructokinase [Clostridia bacterium]